MEQIKPKLYVYVSSPSQVSTTPGKKLLVSCALVVWLTDTNTPRVAFALATCFPITADTSRFEEKILSTSRRAPPSNGGPQAQATRRQHRLPVSHSHPQLSEIALSPRRALDFFNNSNLFISAFLITLLSFTFDSDAEHHQNFVEDILINMDFVLYTTTVLAQVHRTYMQEICLLIENKVGWHFTASRAQAAQ